MVSRDKVQVLGFVPRSFKARLKRIREIDQQLYSESRLVRQGLERIVPELEKELGLFPEPVQVTQDRRRRRRQVA